VRGGEVWWARLDGRTPVVLLSDGRALRVVSPATPAQKRGFVVLTGAEAADDRTRDRIIAAAGPGARAVGAEVSVGTAEGLPFEGVVRVGFPRAGQILCTWETGLADDDLLERAGVLSPAKQHQLDVVMRLAEPLPPGGNACP
jgi:mRNA interferase MazF